MSILSPPPPLPESPYSLRKKRENSEIILMLMGIIHDQSAIFRDFQDKVNNNSLLVCLHMAVDFADDGELLPFIAPCVEDAYDATLRAADIGPAYLALSLYMDTGERAIPIAALAGYWLPSPDNTMQTRFEAVRKTYQRQGYGSLLFTAFELAMVCLARHDPFMAMNLAGETQLTLQVFVDLNDPDWHREMMLRRGYIVVDEEEGASVFEKRVAF
jgi:GNAT superfamily N-acetyltransferase